MRVVLVALAGALLSLPVFALPADAAVFDIAHGFDDTLTIVSGSADLDAPSVATSTAFFRTTGVEVNGIDRACWQISPTASPECVTEAGLQIMVPASSSFGVNAPSPYRVQAKADHALALFIDLSSSPGFGALHVGPSIVASLTGSRITVGDIPAPPAASAIAFTTLNDESVLEVHSAGGALLHRTAPGESPIMVGGTPTFSGPFAADVLVLPFAKDATAVFHAASDAAARQGLTTQRLDQLVETLQGVRFLPSGAKSQPLAILKSAGPLVNEVFNGAVLRTKLSDHPRGLGDVDLAKFDKLTVTGGDGTIDLAGSYTLVVGDFATSASNAKLGGGGAPPVRWWMAILFLCAIAFAGAWYWLRNGPLPVAGGRQQMISRIATALGILALFLVWDWRLNGILGSSMLTTHSAGTTYGLVAAVELGTLVLAGLLIGVPVYFAVRYGFALLREPKVAAFGGTAGVLGTLALGLLILPALVSFLVQVAAV